MIEVLKELDIDIKRCQDVIRENNYLEIVIAIEELNDKYRDKINEIGKNNNDVVWNYSKKDLEKIEMYLINYKEEVILREKEKTIEEKLVDVRMFIESNNIKNKDIIIENINLIEKIKNEELSLDEKWIKLKNFLDLIKTLGREISMYILEIIMLIVN